MDEHTAMLVAVLTLLAVGGCLWAADTWRKQPKPFTEEADEDEL